MPQLTTDQYPSLQVEKRGNVQVGNNERTPQPSQPNSMALIIHLIPVSHVHHLYNDMSSLLNFTNILKTIDGLLSDR